MLISLGGSGIKVATCYQPKLIKTNNAIHSIRHLLPGVVNLCIIYRLSHEVVVEPLVEAMLGLDVDQSANL